jgi:hypothetical protein
VNDLKDRLYTAAAIAAGALTVILTAVALFFID